MITSHEKELDFTHFFTHLQSLAFTINIKLDIDYICTDADQAMANSIKKVFQSCKRIMCWYHLKANVFKNKSKIPIEYQGEVMNDLNKLRYSKSENSYLKRKNSILQKWKKIRLTQWIK